MSKHSKRSALFGAILTCVFASFAASGEETDPGLGTGAPPAPGAGPVDPAALPGLPPALPDPMAPPGLPGLPATGAPPAFPTPAPFGDAAGGFTGFTDPNAASAVPTPPPLVGLGTVTDTTTTEGGALATAGPIELYEFLFRDDENIGVVREKYLSGENQSAEQLKQKRIDEIYQEKYLNPNQPAGLPTAPPPGAVGPGQQGAPDPKAGAAWDFYYEQLEMYDQYVREKLLLGGADVPALEFKAKTTDEALQEQSELQEQFQNTAVAVVNDQMNENEEFYTRLQEREDRRRDFYDWLAEQQREIEDWTSVWARKINGSRWADGEPVRRDDWYYGVDFNSAEPVAIRIDQQDYLLSRAPQDHLAPGQLNVLSSNLTPYDIIDATGTMKNPDMERLRGTLVQSAMTVAASETVTTGTVQLVE